MNRVREVIIQTIIINKAVHNYERKERIMVVLVVTSDVVLWAPMVLSLGLFILMWYIVSIPPSIED
jgi:hypothetical protein